MTITNYGAATDLAEQLKNLPSIHELFISRAENRQSILTKPAGSLGRLEEIAVWAAGWQQKDQPTCDNAQCIVFAGNHGVAERGVSAFPPEVTAQMVGNFKNGGAAINQLTNVAGANLNVVALNLDQPTNDFTKDAAMSAEECCEALQAGAAAVSNETDILLLGEMGIGNTTTAAAVACATFGGYDPDWIGRGTGVDDAALAIKKNAVREACELHKEKQTCSFEILRTVGGRELAAIAGAVLEARYRSIPVILDGFISTAAAAALCYDAPDALDHVIVSHLSVEPGHQKLMAKIDKRPILNLDMRLGEASGAAVALLIVKAALAAHNGMATFDEAGVSENE